MQTIEIAERFCGPPRMGNGGYVAGVLATVLNSDAAEVTIRAAVPLAKPLSLDLHDGTVRLLDADVLVAEASIATAFAETPPFEPSYKEAIAARPRFVGFRQHGFPRCFVCGTERDDGLRIFPGSVEPGDRVIAPWEPDESLASRPSSYGPRSTVLVPLRLPPRRDGEGRCCSVASLDASRAQFGQTSAASWRDGGLVAMDARALLARQYGTGRVT